MNNKNHSHCPTPGPLMIIKNNSTKQATLFRPPCKRWSCPYCGPINAAEWGYIAWSGTKQMQGEGVTMVFMTLTCHEKLTPMQTFEIWPSAWKKLRQRIVRKYGKPEYFMVSERHKSGKLHMHAIMSRNINKTWLKKNSRECGLGYMADVRVVEEAIGAAFYTAKYLTKFDVVWPNGWRRVRLSKNWPRPGEIKVENENEDVRMLHPAPTKTEIEAQRVGYESIGYRVEVSKSCYYDIHGV